MTTALRKVRSWHGPLAAFAALMAGLAAVSAVGCVADSRVLVGAPVWVKPLKFSISFIPYALTLGWMLSMVTQRRLRRAGWWAGTLLAGASTLEMAAITLQVVRGQQSHFNISTGFNRGVFAAMGALVGVIYLCTMAIALVLARSPVADRAVTWAIRLGFAQSVAGMSVGFLMLRPTAAQAAQVHPSLIGAHSVNVPDGGPGLPFLGWSTTGGDLRVPHFIGLHGLQAIPLLAIVLTAIPQAEKLTQRIRVQAVFLGAAAYAGAFGLTLWQALRGQPLTSPDRATLLALVPLALCAATAAGLVGWSARRGGVAVA